MIQAAHNSLFAWFFRGYSRFMMHRYFRKIFLEGDTASVDGPLMVVGNHFSWWDGLFMYYLNARLWERRFHVMMLEEQLKKRSFLRRIGAFSVKGKGHSVISSLRYIRKLLRDGRNVVVLYPQGHFTSQVAYPFRFERGAQYLIDNTECKVKMVVVLVDYFSSKKPLVSFYMKDYNPSEFSCDELEDGYNRFFADCLVKQNKKALLW